MFTSAYDLYLGDKSSLQGYRCKSITRDSAPLVTSKFSTGKQGQSDLDLLKVDGVDNLAGGMFQRVHTDPLKVARVVGHFNRFNENTYPTVPRSSVLSPAPFGQYDIKAENSQYCFMAVGSEFGGLATNYLYKAVAGTPGFVNITLPAAMTGGATTITGHITGLALHRGYLFIGMQHPNGETNNYRYDIAAGTFQNIGGISSKFAVLRGILYTINKDGTTYTCSNEFASAAITYTSVDLIGTSAVTFDMREYNGALWIAKPDGIYRFDGVKGVKVLDHVITKAMQVFNGALYFVAGNWLYRFDGASVTRLQFFAETFTGFASNTDYLFISSTQKLSTYLTDDKFGVQSNTNSARRIYMYDGVGFYLLDDREIVNSDDQYSGIYLTGTQLYDRHIDTTTVAYYYNIGSSNIFASTAITSSSKLDITTSEFDDGFPSVFKSLETIELGFTGIIAGDSLAVGYQYYDGKTWSAWISLGTITSTSAAPVLEITDATAKLFKKLKVSVIGTFAAGSTFSLDSISWRYTLQPRMRWRWQAQLSASGNGFMKDRNMDRIMGDSNTFTNSVLKAVKQKTPIFMLSPDYGKVKTQITNAATSFIVPGQPPIYTDPYNEYPLVTVLNSNSTWEILRVSNVSYSSVNDETTITVLERGYLGIIAAQINANAEFHLAYKVTARLLRESPNFSNDSYNEQPTTGESQLQREFMLEITEF